ncbi:MAG: DUF4960 domain-containing protein [Balneolaceae bacterium]
MTHSIQKRTTTTLMLFALLVFAGAGNAFSQEVGFIGIESSSDDLNEEETAAFNVVNEVFDVTYIQLADIDSDGLSALSDFDVVWWHFSGGEDGAILPDEAVSDNALEAFNTYITDGGGLFLTKLAPQLAAEMGLNEAYPDVIVQGGQIEDSGEWGMYILDEGHAAFDGIPNPFITVSDGLNYDDDFAFWGDPEIFDGTRLATIEVGEDFPQTTVGEWEQGGGLVVFAGNRPYVYTWEGTNDYEDDVNQFTLNVIAYLDANTTSSEIGSDIPDEIALHQNHPNPFNPSTIISFDLNKTSEVTLTVYDMLGRQVDVPIAGKTYQAGQHQMTFDASGLSSGIYLYRIQAGDVLQTRKMNFIK